MHVPEGHMYHNIRAHVPGYYKDLSFVTVGTLSENARDIGEKVRSMGGHIVSAVSRQITALVLGINVRGTVKLMDAKRMDVPVINEDQMWLMLRSRMRRESSSRKRRRGLEVLRQSLMKKRSSSSSSLAKRRLHSASSTSSRKSSSSKLASSSSSSRGRSNSRSLH